MIKFKKYIIYPMQFLFFLLIYYFFKILPVRIASSLSGKIFKILGPLTKNNKTVIRNLILVNKNDKNTYNISKKIWENLGKTIAELSHLNKITKKNNLIKIRGKKYIDNIIKNNEQVIFIAIHQSNWEILAPTLIAFGIKINSVYRHINNSLINKFILAVRKSAYNSKESLLSPKGKKSAQDMILSIKNGYSIALLIDQKDSSGKDIPLFGIPAKTQTGFLKLAKKFNLKIYPIENKRLNNINFEIIIHKPIILKNYNKNFDEKDIMLKIHKIIENWIKKTPESWLWQHKRWG